MSMHNNSNKYKETAVQYYLEDICKIWFPYKIDEQSECVLWRLCRRKIEFLFILYSFFKPKNIKT